VSVFSAFPIGCKYFRGANPVACYTNIWLGVGCLEEGLDYPETLSWPDKAWFNNLNL